MEKELSLYIHIPFCVQKCAYCDFLSFPAENAEREAYVQTLLEEIQSFAKKENRRDVVSVFIGGGTPSVLEHSQITRLVDGVKESFALCPDAEITIEVNPGTVDAEKLQAYKACGINRISFGLQSANEKELKLLGRIHSFSQFEENYQLARKAGFENISIDLMYALPGQTLDSWKETLEKVTALSPDHISAYSLIIEEGTPFYERYQEENRLREKGKSTKILPDEETERAITKWTEQFLKTKGYTHYEISNYGKHDKESIHNIGYWTRREYAGFGLGAASLLDYIRYTNTASMGEYLQKGRDGQAAEQLSKEDAMAEYMFLGLRMMEGVSKSEFVKQFGKQMETVYGQVLDSLKQQGLLDQNDQRVWLTEYGLDVSNYCMAQFLLD